MEKWRNGDMGTQKHGRGDFDAKRHGHMKTWRHGIKILGNSDILRKNQMKTENGSPGDFP